MLKLNIERMLTLSTSHYMEKDDTILTKVAKADDEYAHLNCWVMPTGCGFIIWVPTDNMDGVMEEYQEAGLSKSFCDCVRKARALGCTWIRFDLDVPTVEGFKTFDW